MYYVTDFHIHSKYSRATSENMDLEHLDQFARRKGIKLLGSGDFTHPRWLKELRTKLVSALEGIYRYGETYFILTTEVNNVFLKAGITKKIHNLIFAPNFEAVEKINRKLSFYGDLESDGRPTLTLSASEMVEMVLSVSPDSLIVPSHAWTPWFSVFGANFGFDRIEDCFQDKTKNIYALETGLSSDPAMNWRLSSLDRYGLISNSDAHSPAKIGREANVFSQEMDYYQIMEAIKKKDREKFLFTVEFFPQEGKYHYDGHRKCDVRFSPQESQEHKNFCPKCHKKLTIGVMHRVEMLADRPDGNVPPGAIPFRSMIPLEEIIAETLGKLVGTAAVEAEYQKLVPRVGSEFEILFMAPLEDLRHQTSERLVEGISRVRQGKVKILLGYDGVYGEINIFQEEENIPTQIDLF